METIAARIIHEVSSWADVTAQPHRFGGTEFVAHGHEIGHLHGSRMADLPFPVRVRERLVAEGRAQTHHVLPETGWVSYYIRGEDDVAGALALFRLNYERIVQRHERREIAASMVDDSYDQTVADTFPASDPTPGPTSLL